MSNVVIRRITDPTDAEMEQIVPMLTEAGLKLNNMIACYAVNRDPELLAEWYRCQVGGACIGAHQYAAYLDGSDQIVGVISAYAPGVEMMGDDVQRSRGYYEFFAKCPARNQQWYADFGPVYMAFADTSVGEGARKAAWNINSLCVHPAHQGKGIARLLMNVIEDLAKADKKPIILDVDKAANNSFYQHLGYEVVAKNDIHDFDGKWERTMTLFKKNFA